MTPPGPSAADRPRPGGQEPGDHGESAASPTASAAPRALPLEAARAPAGRGWAIRLPVRAEQVSVTKQVIVRERVVLRRHQVGDVARPQITVRRERLRVGTEGQVEGVDVVRDDLGGSRPSP
jgi:Domain of unknown function (DUF2382)